MIRAVLVDDEAPARARLRALLAEVGGVLVVAECGDAETARAAIAALRPDLVFLDIEMPETRGTALAASLPEPRPFIVFATAYDAFAVEAYQYDAVDYLLKPVTRQRLAGTLERVRNRLARQSDLERDLADATHVQHHLLPRALPALPGYDLGAAALPARGVGGDFHDVLRPQASCAVLVLGDVSGKGMAAGLVASSVQAHIQTAVRHGAWASPAVLVDALNAEVSATTDAARYATLMLARLDCATGHVEYVNAGHPPGLVLAADGSVRARLRRRAGRRPDRRGRLCHRRGHARSWRDAGGGERRRHRGVRRRGTRSSTWEPAARSRRRTRRGRPRRWRRPSSRRCAAIAAHGRDRTT